METTKIIEEDVVIVGAGIAGLSTALGLHRYHTNLYTFSLRFKFS
jgi:glycine/D-amino acid oxidase-like deaminating enzyme